jgi:predicted secreted protein
VNIGSGIAIYLTIWWTALFAILPLGVRSYAEEGKPVPGGGDPSAPVNPNLRRKFITTTWVAAILWAALWAILHFHLVKLPTFSPSR